MDKRAFLSNWPEWQQRIRFALDSELRQIAADKGALKCERLFAMRVLRQREQRRGK